MSIETGENPCASLTLHDNLRIEIYGFGDIIISRVIMRTGGVDCMVSLANSEFLTTRDWHRAVVGGRDLILRRTSAFEHLQLFSGYMREKMIDVYAKQRGEYDNINYHIVDSFDDIEFMRFGNVLCTSVSQTVNDMLDDFDSVDEQSLVEGLSRYYYTNNKSFDGLIIRPENIERFNALKDWAVEYYDEV